MEEIKLDWLRPSRTNPRKTIDPAGLEKLAASIRSAGILAPLLIRPREGGTNGVRFEIVAGERRFRAAKLAGLSTAPCIVRDLTDEQALEAQLAENLEREDVHPLEQAEGFEQLRTRLKWSVEKISEKFGISVSEVYMTLKLLDLGPKARKLFVEEKMTSAHAERIARLSRGDQDKALEVLLNRHWVRSVDGADDYEVETLISVRDLGTWIAREIYRDTAAAPWKATDATLVPKAGPCSTCPKRAGNDPGLKDLKPTACTDGVCFSGKLEIFLLRQLALMKRQNPQSVQIMTVYNHDPKPLDPKAPIVQEGNVKIIRGKKAKRCKHLIPGIFVDGAKVGEIVDVCRNTLCGTHYAQWERSPADRKISPGAVARRRAEILREKIASEFRSRVYHELGKKAADGVDLPTWRAIVGFLYQELVGDSRRPFLKAVGVNVSGDGVMAFPTMLARKLGKANNADLDRILVLLAAASSALRHDYGVDRVMTLAKLLKIKTSRILADVKSNFVKKEPGK